jgi:hypothetical protein
MMNIETKDATIVPTGLDTDFPGTFEVILSAPTLDRDGDVLGSDEWKLPLPEKITFDSDHGMSVASTVGSGVPSINDAGELVVSGTYSSLPRAQEVRTLVNEGHISTTSVAFLTLPKESKDAKPVRELLNGAFVAIPSNREALVLASKGVKTGARNSAADAKQIQSIHDTASSLGADCAAASKSWRPGTKAVAGSFEQNQQAVSDALSALYTGDSVWAYPVATFPDSVVFTVSGDSDAGKWQASYVINDDGTATLGTPERVALVEQITPVKAFRAAVKWARRLVGRKDADNADKSDPVTLIQATDAAIDEAIDLFASVDITTLPAEVQQAIALVQAADTAIDELMDVAGIPDPDEDAEPADTTNAPDTGAGKSVPLSAAEVKSVADADADAVTDIELRARAMQMVTAQYL